MSHLFETYDLLNCFVDYMRGDYPYEQVFVVVVMVVVTVVEQIVE
jgi:hypothetical protein